MKILFVTIVLCLSFSCQRYAGREENVNIKRKNSTTFWESSNSYFNSAYGSIIHDGQLLKDSVIYGYPCKKGGTDFYDNDSLISFILSKDHVMNGNLIPEGSRITMYQNGQPEYIYLTEDATIQDYPASSKKEYCIGMFHSIMMAV